MAGSNPNPDLLHDLRKFAMSLLEQHRDLAKKIRRWIDAHSIASDLSLALDSVRAALRFESTRRDSVDLAVMALKQSATMAYARALERHSEHRGTVSIKNLFSPEQLESHARLCHLRARSESY